MSDTPCVDGCGQDAATIERLRAERDEWKDRRDRAVAQCRFLHQEGMTRRDHHLKHCGAARAANEAEAERDALRELVARVEAVLNDPTHAVRRWIDDTTLVDAAAIRAALAPQNHPRSAADAPEAPGQPERDERGLGGRVEALARVLAHADGYGDEVDDTWGTTGRPTWSRYIPDAERILADPGPLLEALAEAGVLRRELMDVCPMCGGLYWHGCANTDHADVGKQETRRYVTEWRPTDARP